MEINQDETYIGFFDGSAKPNPGIMKIGGYIQDSRNIVVEKYSIELNEGTNNQAEYISFLKLIEIAINKKIKNIKIYGDSALVVNQVNEQWKCKDKKLIEYKKLSKNMLQSFSKWELQHILRGGNKKADKLTR